jgi:transposase
MEETIGLEEYQLVLSDPYWIRLRDELVRKGIPMYIVNPALIRAEREMTIAVAYV